MNTNSRPPSAKIYQFPQKTAATSSASGGQIKSVADRGLRAVPSVEFGSGWYHEAALQAERASKP